MRREIKIFSAISALFLVCYFFPLDLIPFKGPVYESLALVQWYAREHVLLCLVPAFFIAGAISVFLSRDAVIAYLGPDANKLLAYGVASVSGTVLAVCSCTVLPIFSGIHKRGAGLGPATTFLYSGPAINILAIILTARVLGLELGLARAIGAVLFSVIIGLCMHLLFRKDEKRRQAQGGFPNQKAESTRPLWKTGLYFFVMVGILVFANWSPPQGGEMGIWAMVFAWKWWLTGILLLMLIGMVIRWFSRPEVGEWTQASWDFAKQILPLLLLGVLAAGLLLGRPESRGLIPPSVIENLVGGNTILANFFASLVGAFMYFATLTEVPILAGLIGAGMGKGPALALLLAGPALSLPNMLVIRQVIGTAKTLVYLALVTIMATLSGILYGLLF